MKTIDIIINNISFLELAGFLSLAALTALLLFRLFSKEHNKIIKISEERLNGIFRYYQKHRNHPEEFRTVFLDERTAIQIQNEEKEGKE